MSHQSLVWLAELNNDIQRWIIGMGGDGLVTPVSLSKFSTIRLPSLLSVIVRGLEMRDTVGGSGGPRTCPKIRLVIRVEDALSHKS